MSRRILLVSYEFPPVQGSGVWRALGFARHLAQLHWDVTVVCSDRSSWHSRMEPGLLERVPATVRILRVRGRAIGDRLGRVLPPRAIRILRRLFPDPLAPAVIKLTASALRHAPEPPFVVVTSGPPHIVHLVGLTLRALRDCTWVADYRDLWMDDPVMAWRGPYQVGLGRRVESEIMHRADAVVTVSPTWHALLAARRAGLPTALIRNAADLDSPLPAPERPWPVETRVLLFAGTPQPNNMLATFWEGIRRYHERRSPVEPPFKLAFLGLGDDVKQILADLGVSSLVEDLGYQPHGRAVALLRGADGALVMIKGDGTSNTRGHIPAKIYEALALRKYVLLVADPNGDAAELVRDQPHSIAPAADPDAIAGAIRRASLECRTTAYDVPGPLTIWSRREAAIELDQLIQRIAPRFVLNASIPPRGIGAASPPPS